MVRLEADARRAFSDACDAAGVKQSSVLRDLIMSATRHLEVHKHWNRPPLVQDQAAAIEIAANKLLADSASGTARIEKLMESVVNRILEERDTERMIAADAGARAASASRSKPAEAAVSVAPTAVTPAASRTDRKPITYARTRKQR